MYHSIYRGRAGSEMALPFFFSVITITGSNLLWMGKFQFKQLQEEELIRLNTV